MHIKSSYYQFLVFVLINIFLVIVAGSVVRTTQSGMGCPDWPKCFGQYIPPTAMEQVLFQPNKSYNKGQFVKHNDSLFSAKNSFTSLQNFDNNNWQHYNKHGYTKIVIYQTWIEYINRLLGALLGLFIFIQLVWSFFLFKKKSSLFWLSLLLILLTGFQAWLGKTVVDSNLAAVKISIHLAGALALVLVQIYLMHLVRPSKILVDKKIKNYMAVLSIMALVQYFLGVLVRQKIDVIAESNNYAQRNHWLPEVGILYYVHRSFSILLLTFAFFIFAKAKPIVKPKYLPIIILMVAQLIIGIIFNYASFPAFAQPIHLTLASVQISYLFYLHLIFKRNT